MEKKIQTSESVTCGHPDKLCDQIADSILDECLKQDTNSRIAVEVLLTHDKCLIAGEITTAAHVDYIRTAKAVIRSVGYEPEGLDFECRIAQQSPDIAAALKGRELGAGDQGIVYGYATNETLNYMPLPIELAHRLTTRLEECREKGIIKGLLPDGKSQVSVEYNGNRFSKIAAVLISAQHEEGKNTDELKEDIRSKVLERVFAEYDLTDTDVCINPSGRFVLGGYEADTGVTGRKLMVDTYGGLAHHGGGAMSGKDCSKVDRSGAYLTRYIAKNIVAAGLAERCEVSLSYAIGRPKPTMINIDTFYTGIVGESILRDAVEQVFDLSVKGAIKTLELKAPLFAQTAVGGHFGRNGFAWENTDKTEELKHAVFAR